MPAIVSLQPRASTIALRESTANFLLSSPNIYLRDTRPSPMAPSTILQASPRLMSPIHFSQPESHRPSFLSTLTSSAPCSTNTRRNTAFRDTQHHHHHRRHCLRSDCQFGSVGTSIFDQLPWISALDQPQESLSDIADLSQVATNKRSEIPMSGPIRRRRSSLRSNPLATTEDARTLTLPFPRREVLPSNPSTPRSRSRERSSRVRFQHLMPVLRSVNCRESNPPLPAT
jgi:hypothetical protein